MSPVSFRETYTRIDLVGAVLCLVILAAGGYVLFTLGLRESHQIAEEQSALAVELGELTAAAATVMESEVLLKAARERRLAGQETDLPRRPDFGAFYSAAIALAEEMRVDLVRVQPESVKMAQAFAVLPVDVEFTATYENAYAFLRGMMEGFAHCRVMDVNLTAAGEPGVCNVTIAVELLGTEGGRAL